MTVELPYAETHLRELIAAVDSGEQVTIARQDGQSLQLIPHRSAELFDGSRLPEHADGQQLAPDQGDAASGRGKNAIPFAASGDEAIKTFWANLEPFKGHRQLGVLDGTITLPTDEEWRAMDEEIERDFEESRIFPGEAESA